jgi:hypothetical protein
VSSILPQDPDSNTSHSPDIRQDDVVLHAARLWQYDPANDPHYPWANITGEWDLWPADHVPASAVLVERDGTATVQTLIHKAAAKALRDAAADVERRCVLNKYEAASVIRDHADALDPSGGQS